MKKTNAVVFLFAVAMLANLTYFAAPAKADILVNSTDEEFARFHTRLRFNFGVEYSVGEYYAEEFADGDLSSLAVVVTYLLHPRFALGISCGEVFSREDFITTGGLVASFYFVPGAFIRIVAHGEAGATEDANKFFWSATVGPRMQSGFVFGGFDLGAVGFDGEVGQASFLVIGISLGSDMEGYSRNFQF